MRQSVAFIWITGACRFPVVEDGGALAGAIEGSAAYAEAHRAEQEAFCQTYTGACDGKATERILKLIGLTC